jgi:hypothetical protein
VAGPAWLGTLGGGNLVPLGHALPAVTGRRQSATDEKKQLSAAALTPVGDALRPQVDGRGFPLGSMSRRAGAHGLERGEADARDREAGERTEHVRRGHVGERDEREPDDDQGPEEVAHGAIVGRGL